MRVIRGGRRYGKTTSAPARDDAAELRAAIREWVEATDDCRRADTAWNEAIDGDKDDRKYRELWERALDRSIAAEESLRAALAALEGES